MWRCSRSWRSLWGVALKHPLPSRGPGLPGSLAAHWSSGPRPVQLSYQLLDSSDPRPPLVFLHGLFGSKANFQTIGKSLQQQTGRKPELVERLISVDVSPLPTTAVSDFPSYLVAMKSVQIPKELPLSQARKVADQQLTPVIKDSAIRQFLLTNLVKASSGQFEWRVNIEALIQEMDKIMDFPKLQKSYAGPTLFLSGANSTFIQPSHFSEIKRLFPQAQIMSVPGAGHWIHADQPQDFMASVKHFLA
ncbi:sn-1-specific diacylglycerol lipase ABHD11 isoform X2 [Petaurus breviceps papuanus]|uniref:sn-1-specific diacylglycerol lipase ABHD11 isoform X2 n=1 Tax=Petaurus breviceps papuanus TaxID=3040969 RepID=UPI0036D7AD70